MISVKGSRIFRNERSEVIKKTGLCRYDIGYTVVKKFDIISTGVECGMMSYKCIAA